MAAVRSRHGDPEVLLECPDCLARFYLSDRNERLHRANGTVPKCRECRGRQHEPATTEEREELRRWWLHESGLELAAVVAIARGLVLADQSSSSNRSSA